MRYVTYEMDRHRRVGLLDQDGRVLDAGFDGDMVAFIEAGAPLGPTTEVDGAVLRAPLRPRTLRDFLAFEGHLRNAFKNLGREIPPEWYDVPAYYKGLPDTVIGPDEQIPWPSYTEQLDHELELAAVIGADGEIAGFTVMNDWSARDLQRPEMKIGLGPAKGKDFATSIGPLLVTPDELGDLSLEMVARVNGEERSRGSSGTMHHSWDAIVAHAALNTRLYPGDILGSGTVGTGCILEHGDGRWLQRGDVVELEIEGIGVLRNRVRND